MHSSGSNMFTNSIDNYFVRAEYPKMCTLDNQRHNVHSHPSCCLDANRVKLLLHYYLGGELHLQRVDTWFRHA